MAARSALINVMARAAEKAAKGLVRDFGEVEHLQVSRKGPADFVSVADTRAEKILREELAKARPDFGFLMEESGGSKGRDDTTRWIVDPLDGTTNFLHGLPHWAISIAVEKAGEIVAGVVYEPVHDELFWAEKGAGAFLNHSRLRVSERRRMEDALIATGIPFKGHGDSAQFQTELNALMMEVAGIRRWGAASLDLAYVAAGRYDGYWERGLSPWDCAAGSLMVTEAGGFVGEIGGGRNPVFGGSILAANAHLHLPLAKVLRGAERTKPSSPSAGAAASPERSG
ncbi:inositol monophosphatase [Azospirillum sp. RWY-5-1]|uniref:Inositol-1-monophosphatase n=1 Tax=Azospirillum oleiclasticum TaxID=2735135 RepID=A0ABX2TAS4_9PROT|nr:inositol monophosphatase family protein [Azospirillum oleiclasticum]NYZ15300.1 inositol monophosphatase [Azospirillum oleiclasticum]NYZ21279.1 inositol monophosphatase [Azospirillum oleiclasticum]